MIGRPRSIRYRSRISRPRDEMATGAQKGVEKRALENILPGERAFQRFPRWVHNIKTRARPLSDTFSRDAAKNLLPK